MHAADRVSFRRTVCSENIRAGTGSEWLVGRRVSATRAIFDEHRLVLVGDGGNALALATNGDDEGGDIVIQRTAAAIRFRHRSQIIFRVPAATSRMYPVIED